jgi:hypothetical protein
VSAILFLLRNKNITYGIATIIALVKYGSLESSVVKPKRNIIDISHPITKKYKYEFFEDLYKIHIRAR